MNQPFVFDTKHIPLKIIKIILIPRHLLNDLNRVPPRAVGVKVNPKLINTHLLRLTFCTFQNTIMIIYAPATIITATVIITTITMDLLWHTLDEKPL